MAKRGSYKYPRLTILLIVLAITVFIFSRESALISSIVQPLGIVGTIIAGFLYAFSFTAFAATGLLLKMGGNADILTTAIVAGIGSLTADLLILKVARISFEAEFKLLYKEKVIKLLTKPIPGSLQHLLKVVTAMIIIASPLPDEAGVTLLANGYILPKPIFAAISFTLNTLGIYLILYTGSALAA